MVFYQNNRQIIKSSDLQITQTDDGSDTLYNENLNQHYHSTFGAVQESRHIFIESGLKYAFAARSELPGHVELPASELEIAPSSSGSKSWLLTSPLRILEIGFGTGLNALMTLLEIEQLGIITYYTAIEAFPLEEHSWISLNYPHLFGPVDYSGIFGKLHLAAWNKPEEVSPRFRIHKVHSSLESYSFSPGEFDLVYFDAFSPDAQPELWTEQTFHKLGNAMKPGGILVTYSVKGTVVRAIRSAGFTTEKIGGPPGKRHILRAIKS